MDYKSRLQTQHSGTQHNDTQLKITQFNNTQRDDHQHYYIQCNDTQRLNTIILNILAFNIRGTQHCNSQHNVLIVMLLDLVTECHFYCYVESHYVNIGAVLFV